MMQLLQSRFIRFLSTAALMILTIDGNEARAHTVSIGYENAGPGALTFWFGTYHVSGFNEGSFNLTGINGNTFPSTTVPFSLLVGVKPAGLVDGTTNFFAEAFSSGGLVGTDPNLSGPIRTWQGATFTGLQPGDYQFTYIPIANPTADWDPANAAVQTSTVTITGAVLSGTNAVPEPTSIAMAGVAGFVALIRRRRRSTVIRVDS